MTPQERHDMFAAAALTGLLASAERNALPPRDEVEYEMGIMKIIIKYSFCIASEAIKQSEIK